jgi:hypothetical protein
MLCVGSGNLHDYVSADGLLKLSKRGQFPYEIVRIKFVQIHYVTSRKSSCAIVGIKEIVLGGF